MLALIITGVVSFISSDLDDIVVLTLLFTQEEKYKKISDRFGANNGNWQSSRFQFANRLWVEFLNHRTVEVVGSAANLFRN